MSETEKLPFGTSFGHLVRNIYRLQSQLLRLRLAEDGISFGCWYFLRVLWEHDMITQRELSVRTGVNEATTRTAVDRMEAEKLVERRNDPADRRKRYIRLTDRARRLEQPLIAFADDLNHRALDHIPAAAQEKFVGQLADVYANLETMVAQVKAAS